jgi:hypothetical protein
MDITKSCFFIFVFVAIILVMLFRCKLKCGTCDGRNEKYMDFLPTTGDLPTGEGGDLLEGDNLAEFDYVNNITCLQCQRDYADNDICAQYCIQGYRI